MDYPSQSIQAAVEELSRLPGIGRKTALRLALHILKYTDAEAEALGSAIVTLKKNTRRCIRCNNLTDHAECVICTSARRNHTTICIVEETRDVLAIERTGQYPGLYHVLGALINPIEGIGPAQLCLEPLLKRIAEGEAKEVIFALNSTLEGETTAFFLSRKLEGLPIKLSNIARGIPVGSELEFTDELTLARSLLQRMDYSTGQAGSILPNGNIPELVTNHTR